MADVFLSYASEDRERARRLAELIEERRWSVWWDRKIRPGTSFDRMIEHELESARAVVVLWSRHSVESDWVRAEAREGLGRRVLVPVLIEDVRIPLEFRGIQAATLVETEPSPDAPEARALFGAIEAVVGPASGAPASPAPPDRPRPRPIRRQLLLAGLGGAIAVASAVAIVRATGSGGGNGQVATTKTDAAATTGTAEQRSADLALLDRPPSLNVDSKGWQVMELRATLRLLGYLNHRGTPAEEMTYGPETSSAVAQFQKDRNLPADGIAGPQLMSDLRQLARGKARPGP